MGTYLKSVVSINMAPQTRTSALSVPQKSAVFASTLKFNFKKGKKICQIISTGFLYPRSRGKLKSFLSTNDLEIVVHAFISSHLDYCYSLYCRNQSVSLILPVAGSKCSNETPLWYQEEDRPHIYWPLFTGY